MGGPGIQAPNMLNPFARLALTDFQLELPLLAVGAVTPVLALTSGWVRTDSFAKRFGSTSIAGVTVSVVDTDAGTLEYPGGLDVRAGNQRYYPNVSIQLLGAAAVSPIECQVSLTVGGTVPILLWRDDVPNPGLVNLGPFYVPPSATLTIGTNTNGGAGDTIRICFQGIQAEPGVDIPLIPSAASNPLS